MRPLTITTSYWSTSWLTETTGSSTGGLQLAKATIAIKNELHSPIFTQSKVCERIVIFPFLKGDGHCSFISGAGGIRTHTPFRAPVFETGAIPVMRRLLYAPLI